MVITVLVGPTFSYLQHVVISVWSVILLDPRFWDRPTAAGVATGGLYDSGIFPPLSAVDIPRCVTYGCPAFIVLVKVGACAP